MQQELRDRLEIEKQKVENLRIKLPKIENKKEDNEGDKSEEALNIILDELLKENARLEVLSHTVIIYSYMVYSLG